MLHRINGYGTRCIGKVISPQIELQFFSEIGNALRPRRVAANRSYMDDIQVKRLRPGSSDNRQVCHMGELRL